MRRSSDRAQVEPLAALAAVFAVCAGLALYAGVADDVAPGPADRNVPGLVLDDVERQADADGVFDPSGLAPADVAPPGWHVNVTLRTSREARHWGPTPTTDARRASRPVSVHLAPGRIRPGRLTVVLWR